MDKNIKGIWGFPFTTGKAMPDLIIKHRGIFFPGLIPSWVGYFGQQQGWSGIFRCVDEQWLTAKATLSLWRKAMWEGSVSRPQPSPREPRSQSRRPGLVVELAVQVLCSCSGCPWETVVGHCPRVTSMWVGGKPCDQGSWTDSEEVGAEPEH